MQYNLVPADGWWRFSAGKVTAGLAESNGSLPPRVDGFKSPAGWLPIHRDQLRAQRSVTSMGELYLFTHLTCHVLKMPNTSFKTACSLFTTVKKHAIHIIYNPTRGMPYLSMLFYANLNSLASHRQDLSHVFLCPQFLSSTHIYGNYLKA